MLSINTNLGALNAANQFNRTTAQIDKISQYLATGKRILSAADDPAGIGIVSTLKADRGSYNSVVNNIKSGLSLLDVAASSLSTQQTLLTQMKEIATQASSDLLTADQRTALLSQFTELRGQLDTTVANASLFGQNLTGAAAADVDIQSGIGASDQTTITAAKSDATTLGVNASTIDTSANAQAAITAIESAIGDVAVSQSTIGTQITGLEKRLEASQSTMLNLDSTISRIEDADIAQLTAELAKMQVQAQIQAQVMSIANSMPQYVLALLR